MTPVAVRGSSVRPLVFLFVRSFVNGVKRAISSPKRLIGILFFVGYYWFLFLRPYENIGRKRPSRMVDIRPGSIHLPSASVVDAAVFGIFSLVSMFLLLGLFTPRGTFKGADVDVLFPTPVSPKAVLAFRFLRDYLITLIMPLFILLVSGRTAAGALGDMTRGLGAGGASITQRIVFVWVFSAVAWTALAYGVSMLASRVDPAGERLTRLIKWIIAALILVPALIFSLMWRADLSLEGAVAAAHSPILRGMLFVPAASTALVMGGPGALLGGAFLVAITLAGGWVAVGQSGWMYDAAASRGGDDRSTVRELARKNDTAGIYSHLARKGKIKRNRLSARVARMEVTGGKAVLWREMVTTFRLNVGLQIVVSFLFLGFPVALLFIDERPGRAMGGTAFLAMEALLLTTVTMGAGMSSFIEVLRKVDHTKPLPFTPSQVVRWEVLAKSILPALYAVVVFTIALIVRPTAWELIVTGLLLAPLLIAMVLSVQFLIAVMFPDFEDPTQRGFRGLVSLLATATAAGPFFLPVVGAMLLKASPLIGVPLSAAIAIGVGALALWWAGRLYADYNPSE